MRAWWSSSSQAESMIGRYVLSQSAVYNKNRSTQVLCQTEELSLFKTSDDKHLKTENTKFQVKRKIE